MDFRKLCCDISARMLSLVLLYYYLIGSAWDALMVLPGVGGPKVIKFLSENYLLYPYLLLSIIGGLIFLATIVSITKKTPSNSLLIATMSVLILRVIYAVYLMMLYLNDSSEDYVHGEVAKKAQKLSLVCNIAFTLYAVYVFYSYRAEIKKNIANDVPLNGESNPEEGYSRVVPPYASK
ncbi:uncharacterized protein LOC135834603 [Planococcus citri]|uniref:uncharacterized protein LOC135834603 n=1 Tax=Planococcus citri TaxID=170843 RepID=UPI0031F7F0FB